MVLINFLVIFILNLIKKKVWTKIYHCIGINWMLDVIIGIINLYLWKLWKT